VVLLLVVGTALAWWWPSVVGADSPTRPDRFDYGLAPRRCSSVTLV